jgi:uncharacterized membrane protein YhaH (DUF805 family)
MDTFNKYFVDIIKNHYFGFIGRTSRKQFWMFILFGLIVGLLLRIFFEVVSITLRASTLSNVLPFIVGLKSEMPMLSNALSFVVCLMLFLSSLGICVRRLHDINKSGWWMLIALIPTIGFFILLYFFVLRGDEVMNNYGVAPEQD